MERKKTENERDKLIRKLQDALAQVKTLTGLLPVCSHCQKIRNDNGKWDDLELYIRNHSEADFTHGLCPVCAQKLNPDFLKMSSW